MKKIKNPLLVLSGAYTVSFLDGMFSLGFNDTVYGIIGLTALGAIVWLWVVYNNNK